MALGRPHMACREGSQLLRSSCGELPGHSLPRTSQSRGDAHVSGPRVADDYGRWTTVIQRPDIDAGIERGADHCLVRLNGCAQPGILQSDGRRQTL